MPIWAFQERITGNPTPEKAAFVYRFVDCDELFVINQRFLRKPPARRGSSRELIAMGMIEELLLL